ncbi:uncharacterized protein LOC133523342 [Cydia pomonella]|uniref:uncharacterized protein LOC133523342 n=1 Tax=Cydia pomonella TaxID=82600 RepID=UPI002ADE52CC|nr:uncharacterized protein LOC133523342 [Cydia pomonella]
MDVDYVPCCPNCGHKLMRSSKVKFRLNSWERGWRSCSRFSNLLRRKISEAKNAWQRKEPIICDGCERRCKQMYMAQNLCVRPLPPQKSPRRLTDTSIHRELMHGARFKNYLCDAISKEAISDADSERFVRNTEYTVVKIEDVLKEKLLEECLKSESIRYRPMKFPRLNHSSEKLRMIFLNEAIDNSLQRNSSNSGSGVTLEKESKMDVSSETTVTQTCYDGSWKRGPMKNPFRSSRVSKVDNNPDNLIHKNSTFTKSKDILTENKTDARTHSHMETQYSLRVIKAFKKKKKHKSRSIVKKHSDDTYEGQKQEQSKESKLWKDQQLNSNKRKRKNWMLVKKPKTFKETGVSAKLDGLQTILENTQKSLFPPEGMRQQAMYINPSRLLKSLYITRENVDTQCDILTVAKPIASCKCCPQRFNNKASQYSEENMNKVHTRFGMMNQHEKMIFQCQQYQSKIIQSPCNHYPPCELVPSCYQAWYTVNYCLLTYVGGAGEMCCQKPRLEEL